MTKSRDLIHVRELICSVVHATATCCRRCAANWHGTPYDKITPLTKEQLRRVIKAAQGFIAIRLPDLPAEPADAAPNIVRARLFRNGEKDAYDDQAFAALASGIDPTGLLVPEFSNVQVSARRTGLIVEHRIDTSVGA